MLKYIILVIPLIVATCPPGKSPIPGSVECFDCPPGSTSSIGDTQCSLCDAGSYADRAGSDHCNLCTVGKFSSRGATFCDVCEAGTFANGMGSSHCNPCPVGKFSSTGAINCNVCQAGTYADRTGSNHCSLCVGGKFSTTGATYCNVCQAGTYADRVGSFHCKSCAIGKFSSTGAMFCNDCSTGTYAETPGSPVCSSCPKLCAPGYFNSGCGRTTSGICQPSITVNWIVVGTNVHCDDDSNSKYMGVCGSTLNNCQTQCEHMAGCKFISYAGNYGNFYRECNTRPHLGRNVYELVRTVGSVNSNSNISHNNELLRNIPNIEKDSKNIISNDNLWYFIVGLLCGIPALCIIQFLKYCKNILYSSIISPQNYLNEASKKNKNTENCNIYGAVNKMEN